MPKAGLAYQGREFIRHVVPAVLRPARTLWHEVIGFLFLALAVLPIPTGIRAVRAFDGQTATVVRLSLTVVFSVIMAGYGVSSFRRARKISRS